MSGSGLKKNERAAGLPIMVSFVKEFIYLNAHYSVLWAFMG